MAEENTQKKPGFWDYATPILTGMGAAAVTGAYNNYAVNQQNSFNAAEAEKNRQYETQMSNTAYQRAYADMAAAGLNPHLAGGQGGASSPAGTAATGAQAMPLDINGAINAASNAALTRAQLSNIEADTELKGKQSGKTQAETKLTNITTKLQPKLADAKIKLDQANTDKAKQEAITEVKRTAIAGFQAFQLGKDAEKRNWGFEKELEMYKKGLELELINLDFDSSTIGLVLNSVGRTMNAASPFVPYINASGKEWMKGYDRGWKDSND